MVHLYSAASKQMPPQAMYMKATPREETSQWAMVAQFIAGYPQNTLAVKSHKLLKLPSRGTEHFSVRNGLELRGPKQGYMWCKGRRLYRSKQTGSVSTLHGEAIPQTAS